jgi:hypothetical protein
MPSPLVLYSTNTVLAYHINHTYYGDFHYVWCSPFFGVDNIPSPFYPNPPSSSPQDIYQTLRRDVENSDEHSTKIKLNKAGLRHGADVTRRLGFIDDSQRLEIVAKIKRARFAEFRPLLYVIPFPLVRGILKLVPVTQRANPLADEFIIERLPRATFDIINP